MNRKLRIVPVDCSNQPRRFTDRQRGGLDPRGRLGVFGFPWNQYYDVLEPSDLSILATVSTCRDLNKGVYLECGALTEAERTAVVVALSRHEGRDLGRFV